MHKRAHVWFSTGFCAVLSVVFGFTLGSVLLLSMVAGILGNLPDIDQDISLFKHRGFSHSVYFALLVTVPLSIFLAYAGWVTNSLAGLPVFNASIADLGSVPVPTALIYLSRTNFIGFLTDPLVLTFAALFVSMLTHLLLDMITPSGLNLWKKNIRGGILSDNGVANGFFVTVGITITVASILLSIVRWYMPISHISIWLLIGLVSVAAFVIALALVLGRRSEIKKIKCYTAGGEEFCTRKRCTFIKGKKVCVVGGTKVSAVKDPRKGMLDRD